MMAQEKQRNFARKRKADASMFETISQRMRRETEQDAVEYTTLLEEALARLDRAHEFFEVMFEMERPATDADKQDPYIFPWSIRIQREMKDVLISSALRWILGPRLFGDCAYSVRLRRDLEAFGYQPWDQRSA